MCLLWLQVAEWRGPAVQPPGVGLVSPLLPQLIASGQVSFLRLASCSSSGELVCCRLCVCVCTECVCVAGYVLSVCVCVCVFVLQGALGAGLVPTGPVLFQSAPVLPGPLC